jgi:AcrR family transcriptional regulator
VERRLTQRGRERRRQLMDVAARLFADQGYHPTSVADIVDAAEVGKGVFYWYFDSKEELFVEILRDAQISLRRRQQAALANEPDPVRRIELGVIASMHWYAENRHVVNLFSFAATEAAFATTIRTAQEHSVNDAMRHVRAAIECGLIPDADPLIVTHAILGVTGQLVRTLVVERGEDPQAVADAANSFVLNGVLGRMKTALSPAV